MFCQEKTSYSESIESMPSWIDCTHSVKTIWR